MACVSDTYITTRNSTITAMKKVAVEELYGGSQHSMRVAVLRVAALGRLRITDQGLVWCPRMPASICQSTVSSTTEGKEYP